MAFWGCPLKPGEWKAAQLPGGEILHVSQVCLHEPKPGKNYLQIQVKGTTYTVACLEKDKREHDALDLMFSPEDEPKFCSKGSSHIHLVGYMEPEVDIDESEEPAQKKAVPAAKAAASPKMLAATKASPKVAPAPSPKAAPAASPKLSPKLAAAAKEAEAKAAAAKAAEAEEDSESDLLLEGEEGEEEEPRVRDPVVDEASSKKAAPAESSKRKAPAEAAGGPAAKKAKDDTEPLKPEEGDYVQKLVAYLKTNGKTNIGLLGSKVQRPKNLPKLKDILSKNAGKFKITGDAVEAK